MSKKSGKRAIPVRSKIGLGGGGKSQVQKLQADFARIQEELKGQTTTITAGGGVITVTVNGNQEIKELRLSPEVVDPDDVEMLQDLIVAAVNEALDKSRQMMAQQFSGLTGGLGLEGMF